LAAHGGIERYRQHAALRARFSAGGLAFALKLRGRRPQAFEATFDTSAPRATLHSFPEPGLSGRLLADGAVAIETDTGEEIARRVRPREAIHSPRRLVRWDDLDFLYFCAYAAWSYFTAPFHLTLPGIAVTELPAWEGGAQRWARLGVRYPAGFPAHSRDQVLYIGGDGLIRRVDYTAEVFGRWARAAHLCDEARDMGDGLVHPTRRRVHPRLMHGRPLKRVTLVAIDVHEVGPASR
jgi:hypothetical protein